MSSIREIDLPNSTNPVQLTEINVPKNFIDRYGHVNYKRFPKLFERGQDDYMSRRGIGFMQMEKVTGLKFPVVSIKVTYRAELKKDDKPVISTTIPEGGVRDSSMSFNQEMRLGNRIVAEQDLVVVTFDPIAQFKTPIPQYMRERLLQPLE